MAAELTPEVNEALRKLTEHSRALMEALADLARQDASEFKQRPGREFMDREEAMRNVIRIRDAHTLMHHSARSALVAAGRAATGVPTVQAQSSREQKLEAVVRLFLKAGYGHSTDHFIQKVAIEQAADALPALGVGVPQPPLRFDVLQEIAQTFGLDYNAVCRCANAYLDGVAIPDDADAPVLRCTTCGRKSWTGVEAGLRCNMPQPNGSRCDGILIAAAGVPTGQQQSREGSGK